MKGVFDRLRREAIWERMKEMRIEENIIERIKDMYKGTLGMVRIKDKVIGTLLLEEGVSTASDPI